jgi:PAS domain S-box-containing protein
VIEGRSSASTLLDELLAAARGRVGEVLDRLPAVVAVLRGPHHVVEYGNPLFLGLARGEPLVGRPVAEVFTQPENRKFIDLLDRVYETGESSEGEEWAARVADESGAEVERHFDFAFVPLRAGSGAIGGVLVHAVEVSRLVEARTHALESERRLDALVEANIVGVTVSDEERTLEANDAWLAIVGRRRDELDCDGLSWRAHTPPEWRATDDHALEQIMREGWIEPYEKEYVRPDGTRVPVLVSGVRIDLTPLRVVALVIDLSERRAGEREREQLLAREREARREAELAADRTARLQRVTAALSAAITADEVGAVVVDQAIDAFEATAGALAFPDGEDVEMRFDCGFEEVAMAPWRRFPLHTGMPSPVGDVLLGRGPVLLEDHDDWERYRELRSKIEGRFAAMAVIPLNFGGRVLGGLVLCNREPRRFMAADRAFLTALADQAAQALERARLYEERAYVARTLQEGLLPERLDEVPGLEVAVRYHSIADGGAVGGDFYDCFSMPAGRWLVAVGDVAGKGTAAAVLTGLARHTLRAIALHEERPEEMLRFLNEALRRQSAEAAFCTVGCARLEPSADGFDVCLASGGHPYPLVIHADGSVEEIVVRGTLLGVEAAPVLEQVTLELRHGDTLVLYTDGVVDARDASGDHFGEERLLAALRAAAGRSAEAVAAAVDETVAAFEPDRRRDDRAIVVLRVSPK